MLLTFKYSAEKMTLNLWFDKTSGCVFYFDTVVGGREGQAPCRIL